MWRPKWKKDTVKRVWGKHYESFNGESFTDKLRRMKTWDYLYTRSKDNVVSWAISMAWLKWEFTTERVVVFHTKQHSVEEWVLITKL